MGLHDSGTTTCPHYPNHSWLAPFISKQTNVQAFDCYIAHKQRTEVNKPTPRTPGHDKRYIGRPTKRGDDGVQPYIPLERPVEGKIMKAEEKEKINENSWRNTRTPRIGYLPKSANRI